jgi:hypothetical protein
MDTTAWLDLWHDSILRDYFSALAYACSREERIMRDLLATAWIAVGEHAADIAPEWAMHVGAMALMGRYKDCYRPPLRPWHDDAARKRTARVSRKYFVIVSRPPALMCDNRG